MTRILVVDDEDLSSSLIGAMLDSGTYQVLSASNGFEALDLARTEKPHLIFIDLNMPMINGLEVCRLIRRLSEQSRTHIVLFSADPIRGEQKEIAKRAGADAVLEKPFSQTALSSLIAAASAKVEERA